MDLNSINLESLSDEELDALESQLLSTQKQPTSQMPSIPENLESLSDEELDALENQLKKISPQEPKSETNKLLEKAQQALQPPPETAYSSIESGLMGALNGVSLGGIDEIGGALKTAYDVSTGNASFSQVNEQFKKNRQAIADEFKEAEENNPGAFQAGDIAGSLGTAFVPGLGAVRGIKGAAALGATSGFLRSEKDIAGRVTDAALGGGLGAAGGFVGEKIAAPLSKSMGNLARKKASQATQNYSQKIMAKSLGFSDEASAANLESILKVKGLKGINDLVEVADEIGVSVQAIARGGKLPGPQEVANRIDVSLDGYGKLLSNVMDEVDTIAGGPSVNPIMLMEKIRRQGRMAKELTSDVGYVAKEAQDFLDDILVPLQQESMWTTSRLWSFKTQIRRSIPPKALDGAGSSLTELKRKLHSDLGDFLTEIIENSGPSGKNLKETFSQASRKYAKLASVQDLVNENLEIASQGVQGGLRRAVNLAPLINYRTVGAGALGGVPGVAAALALDGFVKSPMSSKLAAKSLTKVSAVLTKNSEYASRLIQAAGRSQQAFDNTLAAGEAIYDFTRSPLPRTSQAVKENFSKIVSLLEMDNPQVAKNLRDAVNKNDDVLIQGIMSGLSLSSAAAQYIEAGVGWDGKAISEGDVVEIQGKIKSAPVSSRQKAILMQQFNQDKKIPQIEEEKPFYKVYDPSLKTSVMK